MNEIANRGAIQLNTTEISVDVQQTLSNDTPLMDTICCGIARITPSDVNLGP